MPDRGHECDQRCGRIRNGIVWCRGIETASEFEEIGALGLRQSEGRREPSQRLRQGLDGPPLLDLRAPSRADARPCRQFLPSKPRCAPARPGFQRPHPRAMGTDELAKKPPLVGVEHEEIYNRINPTL